MTYDELRLTSKIVKDRFVRIRAAKRKGNEDFLNFSGELFGLKTFELPQMPQA